MTGPQVPDPRVVEAVMARLADVVEASELFGIDPPGPGTDPAELPSGTYVHEEWT